MFSVNHQTNRIAPVQVSSFSDLKLTERNHLQEWLAHQPDSLGEDLLIIQKEFDGFHDTRERLDLLALDKNGNLVIIENKLDDSGRDVVWQGIKYASYCASLSKLEIVRIFQQYLDRYVRPPVAEELAAPNDASSLICEFLDAPDLDELKLNTGNSQRLMLVAANFRKEVTSTALWLLGQGVSVQCFKVTPYSVEQRLLISIDQIIPPPEAKELMISMSTKESDEKSTEVVVKRNHGIRYEYWAQALGVIHSSNCSLFNGVSASNDHWISAGSGFSGCVYTLAILRKEIRVELYLGRANKEDNKALFEQLIRSRGAIEAAFGSPLDWLESPEKKSSRIQFMREADGFNTDSWPELIAWHLEHIVKPAQAFKEPLKRAADAIRQ